MKTIKLIDLLVKIANGEEIPKKIAIQNEVLIYNEGEILNLQDSYYMADNEDATWRIWAYELNDEVEILEDTPKEEKKIPEKLPKSVTDNACSSKDMRLIAITLNKIIDYLKNKGDE